MALTPCLILLLVQTACAQHLGVLTPMPTVGPYKTSSKLLDLFSIIPVLFAAFSNACTCRYIRRRYANGPELHGTLMFDRQPEGKGDMVGFLNHLLAPFRDTQARSLRGCLFLDS
jgi:hypothetical protein